MPPCSPSQLSHSGAYSSWGNIEFVSSSITIHSSGITYRLSLKLVDEPVTLLKLTIAFPVQKFV